MALITCENLSLGYDGNTILTDLNFKIEEGNYLCIVGENGSGKSTLMKTMLHLHQPIAGNIQTGDGLLQNDIGYLPQQTLIQRDFPATVKEIVISGMLSKCGWRPFYSKQQKAEAYENMVKLGLETYENRCYRELSGGLQQRVLLARALCASKRLLILDEPVSGLDPKVTEQMYQLIKEINQNDGITIVMVSHDIDAALRYATHILHIGKKTFFGTKEDYIQSDVGKKFILFEGGM